MQKVRVFTETFFHGSFGDGRGEYYILLEYIGKNGVITKESYGRYQKKTKNQIELIAVIEALERFKKKCEIELHMVPGYVSESIKQKRPETWKQENWKNKKGEIRKYSTLWEKYLEVAAGNEIIIVEEKESEYARAMRTQLQIWLKR